MNIPTSDGCSSNSSNTPSFSISHPISDGICKDMIDLTLHPDDSSQDALDSTPPPPPKRQHQQKQKSSQPKKQRQSRRRSIQCGELPNYYHRIDEILNRPDKTFTKKLLKEDHRSQGDNTIPLFHIEDTGTAKHVTIPQRMSRRHSMEGSLQPFGILEFLKQQQQQQQQQRQGEQNQKLREEVHGDENCDHQNRDAPKHTKQADDFATRPSRKVESSCSFESSSAIATAANVSDSSNKSDSQRNPPPPPPRNQRRRYSIDIEASSPKLARQSKSKAAAPSKSKASKKSNNPPILPMHGSSTNNISTNNISSSSSSSKDGITLLSSSATSPKVPPPPPRPSVVKSMNKGKVSSLRRREQRRCSISECVPASTAALGSKDNVVTPGGQGIPKFIAPRFVPSSLDNIAAGSLLRTPPTMSSRPTTVKHASITTHPPPECRNNSRRRHSMTDCFIPPSFSRLPFGDSLDKTLDGATNKDVFSKKEAARKFIAEFIAPNNRSVSIASSASSSTSSSRSSSGSDSGSKNSRTAKNKSRRPRFISPLRSSSPVRQQQQNQHGDISKFVMNDVDYSKCDAALERYQTEREGKISHVEKGDDKGYYLPTKQREVTRNINMANSHSHSPKIGASRIPRRCSMGGSGTDITRGNDFRRCWNQTRGDHLLEHQLDVSNATKSTKTNTASSSEYESAADAFVPAHSHRDIDNIYISSNSGGGLDDSISTLGNSIREEYDEDTITQNYGDDMSLGSLENVRQFSLIREVKEVSDKGSLAGVADFEDDERPKYQNMAPCLVVPVFLRPRYCTSSGGDVQVPSLAGIMEEMADIYDAHRESSSNTDRDIIAEHKVYKDRHKASRPPALERNHQRQRGAIAHEMGEEREVGGGFGKRMRRHSDCGVSHGRTNKGVESCIIDKDSWKNVRDDLETRRDAEGRVVSRAKTDRAAGRSAGKEGDKVSWQERDINSDVKQLLQEHETFLSAVEERYNKDGQEK